MRTLALEADHLPRRLPAAALLLMAALAALALAGCGTPRPPPGAPGAAPGATPPTAATTPTGPPGPAGRATPAPADAATAMPRTPPLVVERQWLQSWFAGTPVRIVQQGSGPVAIDVPQAFCFDIGRSSVKAPLAAVLDKLALSLRRTPTARLQLLAAPGDKPGTAATPATATLALQRAAQMRSHLLSRGVQAAQLGPPMASKVAAAQLRLELAAP